MNNPGYLVYWRPDLSRGDILKREAGTGSPGLVRAAVALGLVIAPIFAIATVCVAFLVFARLA